MNIQLKTLLALLISWILLIGIGLLTLVLLGYRDFGWRELFWSVPVGFVTTTGVVLLMGLIYWIIKHE